MLSDWIFFQAEKDTLEKKLSSTEQVWTGHFAELSFLISLHAQLVGALESRLKEEKNWQTRMYLYSFFLFLERRKSYSIS